MNLFKLSLISLLFTITLGAPACKTTYRGVSIVKPRKHIRPYNARKDREKPRTRVKRYKALKRTNYFHEKKDE